MKDRVDFEWQSISYRIVKQREKNGQRSNDKGKHIMFRELILRV